MKKSITVKIDPMGNPEIEANGFNGQGCAEATKGLEEALAGGSGEFSREYKPEWNNPEDNTNQEEVHQSW